MVRPPAELTCVGQESMLDRFDFIVRTSRPVCVDFAFILPCAGMFASAFTPSIAGKVCTKGA